MDNIVLDVAHVSKNYGSKKVLNDLTLRVARGSVIGLLGKNGAGKTTLIKSLLGLVRPKSGQIRVLGDDPWDFRESTKEHLGYVPQAERVYPWLKVKQLTDYTGSFYPHWNNTLVNRLITEWELDPDQKVGLLSEGEAQKLSIIMALGHEPEVLILDEPVASLDPLARRQFLKTILEIVADRACTILFSTHITSDLERVADQVAVLKNGMLDFCGPLDDLKDKVKRLRIQSSTDIPRAFDGAGVISVQTSGRESVVCVRNYTPEFKAKLEQSYKASVRVEDLNLEEIFLEINR